MFSARNVIPIITTRDVERAREFYERKLGFRQAERTSDGGVILSSLNGHELELAPRDDPRPSPHTLVSFEVGDLVDAVRDLETRGIVFEDYDEPVRTRDHIADTASGRAAWFKDPDGHVLCVHESRRPETSAR